MYFSNISNSNSSADTLTGVSENLKQFGIMLNSSNDCSVSCGRAPPSASSTARRVEQHVNSVTSDAAVLDNAGVVNHNQQNRNQPKIIQGFLTVCDLNTITVEATRRASSSLSSAAAPRPNLQPHQSGEYFFQTGSSLKRSTKFTAQSKSSTTTETSSISSTTITKQPLSRKKLKKFEELQKEQQIFSQKSMLLLLWQPRFCVLEMEQRVFVIYRNQQIANHHRNGSRFASLNCSSHSSSNNNAASATSSTGTTPPPQQPPPQQLWLSSSNNNNCTETTHRNGGFTAPTSIWTQQQHQYHHNMNMNSAGVLTLGNNSNNITSSSLLFLNSVIPEEENFNNNNNNTNNNNGGFLSDSSPTGWNHNQSSNSEEEATPTRSTAQQQQQQQKVKNVQQQQQQFDLGSSNTTITNNNQFLQQQQQQQQQRMLLSPYSNNAETMSVASTPAAAGMLQNHYATPYQHLYNNVPMNSLQYVQSSGFPSNNSADFMLRKHQQQACMSSSCRTIPDLCSSSAQPPRYYYYPHLHLQQQNQQQRPGTSASEFWPGQNYAQNQTTFLSPTKSTKSCYAAAPMSNSFAVQSAETGLPPTICQTCYPNSSSLMIGGGCCDDYANVCNNNKFAVDAASCCGFPPQPNSMTNGQNLNIGANNIRSVSEVNLIHPQKLQQQQQQQQQQQAMMYYNQQNLSHQNRHFSLPQPPVLVQNLRAQQQHRAVDRSASAASSSSISTTKDRNFTSQTPSQPSAGAKQRSKIFNFFARGALIKSTSALLRRTKSTSRIDASQQQMSTAGEIDDFSNTPSTSGAMGGDESTLASSFTRGNLGQSEFQPADDDDDENELLFVTRSHQNLNFSTTNVELPQRISLEQTDTFVMPMHASIAGGNNCCFSLFTKSNQFSLQCANQSEREFWVRKIGQLINVGDNLSFRVHHSFTIWIQECKGLALATTTPTNNNSKSRNFLDNLNFQCETYLDENLYGRTQLKPKQSDECKSSNNVDLSSFNGGGNLDEHCFWGEVFEFDHVRESKMMQIRVLSVAVPADVTKSTNAKRHGSVSGASRQLLKLRKTNSSQNATTKTSSSFDAEKRSKSENFPFGELNFPASARNCCMQNSICIGKLNLPVSDLAEKRIWEGWFPVKHSEKLADDAKNGRKKQQNSKNFAKTTKNSISEAVSSSSSNSSCNSGGNMALRMKVKYQIVHILPLHCYDRLLQALRLHYAELCAFLDTRVGVKAKEELAVTLVRIMHACGLAEQYIADVVMAELSGLSDGNLVFRGNSLATKSVEHLMKLVGGNYLQETLGVLLRSLTTSPGETPGPERKNSDATNNNDRAGGTFCGVGGDMRGDCEVDPTRLPSNSSGKKSSSAPPVFCAEQSVIKQHQANLVACVEKVYYRIINSHHYLPAQLSKVFCLLRERLEAAGKDELTNTLLSACVFLRFLCPAILNPHLFGLLPGYPSSPALVRKLTLTAKTIQTLANFSRFSGKEHYMQCMNDFVEREQESMRTFLMQISTSIPHGLDFGSDESLTPQIDLGRELSLLQTLLSEHMPSAENSTTTSSTSTSSSGGGPNFLHNFQGVKQIYTAVLQLNPAHQDAADGKQMSFPAVTSANLATTNAMNLLSLNEKQQQQVDGPFAATASKVANFMRPTIASAQHHRQHHRRDSASSQQNISSTSSTSSSPKPVQMRRYYQQQQQQQQLSGSANNISHSRRKRAAWSLQTADDYVTESALNDNGVYSPAALAQAQQHEQQSQSMMENAAEYATPIQQLSAEPRRRFTANENPAAAVSSMSNCSSSGASSASAAARPSAAARRRHHHHPHHHHNKNQRKTSSNTEQQQQQQNAQNVLQFRQFDQIQQQQQQQQPAAPQPPQRRSSSSRSSQASSRMSSGYQSFGQAATQQQQRASAVAAAAAAAQIAISGGQYEQEMLNFQAPLTPAATTTTTTTQQHNRQLPSMTTQHQTKAAVGLDTRRLSATSSASSSATTSESSINAAVSTSPPPSSSSSRSARLSSGEQHNRAAAAAAAMHALAVSPQIPEEAVAASHQRRLLFLSSAQQQPQRGRNVFDSPPAKVYGGGVQRAASCVAARNSVVMMPFAPQQQQRLGGNVLNFDAASSPTTTAIARNASFSTIQDQQQQPFSSSSVNERSRFSSSSTAFSPPIAALSFNRQHPHRINRGGGGGFGSHDLTRETDLVDGNNNNNNNQIRTRRSGGGSSSASTASSASAALRMRAMSATTDNNNNSDDLSDAASLLQQQQYSREFDQLRTQLARMELKLHEAEQTIVMNKQNQRQITSAQLDDWQRTLFMQEEFLKTRQREAENQYGDIVGRLSALEHELRREQGQTQTVLFNKQHVIEEQERRIRELDAQNSRLVAALDGVRDRLRASRAHEIVSPQQQQQQQVDDGDLTPTATTAAAAAGGFLRAQNADDTKTVAFFASMMPMTAAAAAGAMNGGVVKRRSSFTAAPLVPSILMPPQQQQQQQQHQQRFAVTPHKKFVQQQQQPYNTSIMSASSYGFPSTSSSSSSSGRPLYVAKNGAYNSAPPLIQQQTTTFALNNGNALTHFPSPSAHAAAAAAGVVVNETRIEYADKENHQQQQQQQQRNLLGRRRSSASVPVIQNGNYGSNEVSYHEYAIDDDEILLNGGSGGNQQQQQHGWPVYTAAAYAAKKQQQQQQQQKSASVPFVAAAGPQPYISMLPSLQYNSSRILRSDDGGVDNNSANSSGEKRNSFSVIDNNNSTAVNGDYDDDDLQCSV